MPDPVITNVDTGSPPWQDVRFQDDTLNLAGADVLLDGTILARDSVSLKLALFVKGGSTNENGIPKAILTRGLTTAGSGDVAVRVGIGGTFEKERLVIDADGDDSNIDDAVKDQLRDFAMLSEVVTELNKLDNQ